MPATWKISLQLLNFLPFFSWEILFSICCLLILFTHWALSRNQRVSDQEDAWVLLVQLWSQHQSPADHSPSACIPMGLSLLGRY